LALRHHDLCFGCGQANLFGLQLELEATGDGVAGRFFVKQDHQGPPGFAHGGVLAAALDEAMSLAVHAEGVYALTRKIEIELHEPAPLGTFVRLKATVDRRRGNKLWVSAAAFGEGEREDGGPLAESNGIFVEPDEPAVA
jgi:acyl-coenzyme A thioesterase PaaI-like protein